MEADEAQPNDQSEKDNEIKSPADHDADKSGEGVIQKDDFKVLNKDGSLSDTTYNNQPGGGALEGTVGIGT